MTTPADAHAAAERAKHPTANEPPARPVKISDGQRAILTRHAAEKSALDIDQYNARVEMNDRHAAETKAQAAVDTAEAKK